MSYRHAWGVLHRIGENAGGDIVASSRGGKKGGETITVTSVNDAPVANDDHDACDEDATTTGNVLVNDTDANPGDTLSVGLQG